MDSIGDSNDKNCTDVTAVPKPDLLYVHFA